MRILLIDVYECSSGMQSKYHSLGLGYLASYLPDQIKKSVTIKIANFENFHSQLDTFKPELVGISSVSQNFYLAKQIAIQCRERDIKVLIGKSHISALPECLDENMDVGVIGEGEEAFKELVELFLDDRFNIKELSKVKGIVYRDQGKLIITQPRPLIQDMDSIPFPDRMLLGLTPDDAQYMFTSRGCPYRCAFCFSSRFWDKTRFFSAEYVIREIKEIYNTYKPLRITFCDDLFIADLARLRKIVELIKKEKCYKQVKFTVSVRANLVTKESADLLKELGVDIVTMGLESGNQRILNFLKGESINLKHNQNAINILKGPGLQVSASFIIGSPDETRSEVMDTYNFIKKSRLDLFEVNVLLPLPGTPIWDDAKSRGLVSENMDWKLLDIDFIRNYDNYLLLSEKLARNEILELYKKFMIYRNWKSKILLLKYIYRRHLEICRFLEKKFKHFLLKKYGKK